MMMSKLKLKKTSVNQSILLVNEGVNFSKWMEHNSIEVKMETELGVKKDSLSSGRIVLDVELFSDDYIENEEPFFCSINMVFFFEDEGYEDGDEDVISKYAHNMVSMAYPYIRAHISAVTALSGIPGVIVPAINVFEFFEEKTKNSIDKENK